MKISDILPRFYQWLQFGRNSNATTVECYRRILEKFIKDMGDMAVNKIKIEDIWRWREMLTQRGVVPQSQKGYLLSLKVFLGFCKERKLARIDTAQITIPKLPSKEVVYLKNGEVNKFTNSIKDLKYRALTEALLGTGMRIGEALSLNRNDIKDHEAKVIGKNNKERTVYFSDRALWWLKKYLKTRKDDCPALFISSIGERIARGTVDNFFWHHRKQIGLDKKITPHICRHTMATNLVNNGADISFVRDLLGQQDIKVTARYYLGRNQQKLKEVHRKYLNYATKSSF